MPSLKYKDENGVWHKVSGGGGASTADKIPVSATVCNELSITSGSSVEDAIRKLNVIKAPVYTYSTEDLEAGVTPLETGKLHFVYE